MSMQGRHKTGQALMHAILALVAIYTLAPLVFLIFNSFKSNNEIVDSPVSAPSSWSFQYIISAAQQIHFFRAIWITFVITFISVLLLVMVSSLAAWVMVRSKSILGTVLYLGFTAAMLIPFQSLMYPLLDLFEKIGLKNIPGLIFMYGGFGLSMSVFLYHGFIKSVPQSLEEAAIIDGANIFQMFFKVVFPLLKGTTVTVIVLNGMWIWNDYLLPFLVIGNSNGVKTLTLELYFAKLTSGQYGNPWELIFPAVLVTIIPIVILYIFLQKYIVAGVAEGAVKMYTDWQGRMMRKPHSCRVSAGNCENPPCAGFRCIREAVKQQAFYRHQGRGLLTRHYLIRKRGFCSWKKKSGGKRQSFIRFTPAAFMMRMGMESAICAVLLKNWTISVTSGQM